MASRTQPTVPSPPQQMTLKRGRSLKSVSPGNESGNQSPCLNGHHSHTYTLRGPALGQVVHLARIEHVLELPQDAVPLATTALRIDEHQQRAAQLVRRRDLEVRGLVVMHLGFLVTISASIMEMGRHGHKAGSSSNCLGFFFNNFVGGNSILKGGLG